MLAGVGSARWKVVTADMPKSTCYDYQVITWISAILRTSSLSALTFLSLVLGLYSYVKPNTVKRHHSLSYVVWTCWTLVLMQFIYAHVHVVHAGFIVEKGKTPSNNLQQTYKTTACPK